MRSLCEIFTKLLLCPFAAYKPSSVHFIAGLQRCLFEKLYYFAAHSRPRLVMPP